MNTLDKIIELAEHPERFTEAQMAELLSDEENMKMYLTVCDVEAVYDKPAEETTTVGRRSARRVAWWYVAAAACVAAAIILIGALRSHTASDLPQQGEIVVTPSSAKNKTIAKAVTETPVEPTPKEEQRQPAKAVEIAEKGEAVEAHTALVEETSVEEAPPTQTFSTVEELMVECERAILEEEFLALEEMRKTIDV